MVKRAAFIINSYLNAVTVDRSDTGKGNGDVTSLLTTTLAISVLCSTADEQRQYSTVHP